jgi:SAM-dependent methyltransferase
MRELKSWYQDEHFWKVVEPILFGEKRVANAATEVDQLTKLLKLQTPAKVLDLCCGLGRHSLELARRGFDVTGVDRTGVYLRRAQKQANSEGLKIEFVQEDMRQFCRPNSFDLTLNLFTSFGYFESPAEDRRVLVNVHKSLKPGGRLVMDLVGKEIIARVFRERDWREEEGVIWLEQRSISQDWTWMDNRWILLRGDKRDEFRVSHRIYSAAELTGLLKDCGFKKIQIHGNLVGAPYDHLAERLVVIAHK